MTRPLILMSGQWSDVPLEELASLVAEWGYQGMELCSWGHHLNLTACAEDDSMVQEIMDQFSRFELSIPTLAIHRLSQGMADFPDASLQRILPEHLWGDGDAEGIQQRTTEAMHSAAIVAQKMGVTVVSGFSGSRIWHRLSGYPYPTQEEISQAFAQFAETWHPILDQFQSTGTKYALEVHPGQMAFDIPSAERLLSSLDHREEIGFTFDPSHFYWMGMDPCEFLLRFPDRIFHVHLKDIAVRLDGRNSLLNGCLGAGDLRRGWENRAPGRGHIDWESIFRTLNSMHYQGPLSVEIADTGMDRLKAAEETVEFIQRLNFEPPPENRPH